MTSVTSSRTAGMSTTILCVMLFFAVRGSCKSVNHVSGRAVVSWMWNGQDYPNPKTEYQRCGQEKSSTICDPDSILTPQDVSRLNDLIQKLQNRSPCLCKENCAEDAHKKGLIVGVALMNTLNHPMHQTKEMAAANLTKVIMNNWQLGTCGNEIIILVAAETNVVDIQGGQAANDFISTATIDEIFEQCKDHFKTEHYYQGLESVISSLYDTVEHNLAKAPAVNPEGPDTNSGNIGLTVGLVVGCACIAGFAAMGFLMMRHRRMNRDHNGFMYDGSGPRPGSRSSKTEVISPIMKTPVVFPDAIYQPCSIEDTKKPQSENHPGSEDEEEAETNEDAYLQNLEENPAYESADTLRVPRALSVVDESPEHHIPEKPLRGQPADVHKLSFIRDEKHRDPHV